MKYYKILIILCIGILLMGGCVLKGDFSNTEQTPITISPPSLAVENTPQNPIVEDDPLLNLTPEEFEIEYNKLPDDYRIKVNKKFVEKYFLSDYKSLVIKNGTITKKQAEKVSSLFKHTSDEEYNSLSLKGLRYFRNIKSIFWSNSNLSDIVELSYINKLNDLRFYSCKLEKAELGIEIRRFLKNITLKNGNFNNLTIQNCGLTNLDFLSGFSDLEGVFLNLVQNEITDLTPLSNLKFIYDLDLADNKITDLTPIASLEVGRIVLSGNPITDISPLKTLKIKEIDALGYASIELADLDIDYDMAKEIFRFYLQKKRLGQR